MKQRNMYRIIIGILMTVFGLAIILMSGGDAVIGTVLLCAGLAFLVTGIIRHRKYGDEPESDERSKKIGAYGLSYSWFLTFLVLFVIFWADFLHLWSPDVGTLSVLLILLMGISAKGFQMYLFRKGDVD